MNHGTKRRGLTRNRMAAEAPRGLILKMGLLMTLSMILQALYNVIDTMFVINMGEGGATGNLALSAAFPVQILMIAVGVGTGVGLNAVLSKSLGEGNKKNVDKAAGNGIFLIALFYLVFLLFGWFAAKPYMRLMSGDESVREAGVTYLRICCCLSVGALGFAVAERFLIATGKTLYSMIAQVTGALTNIALDYVFIYPMRAGVAGAAYATVIGQIVSLAIALFFHFATNKEIGNDIKNVRPDGKIIRSIYKIGFPAFLMQGMLSLMMFGVLLIIGTIKDGYTAALLTGSFGIYYKLMQVALFAAFGLSNTLITLISYNYGSKDYARVKTIVKYGVAYTVAATLSITALFQIFASPVSHLFALTMEDSAAVSRNDVIETCKLSLHIATLGYAFMGFSVAAQGVLQGLGEEYSPLLISALRLLAFVLPVAYLFTLSDNVVSLLWWTFPVAETLTAAITFFILRSTLKKRLQQSV